jgi:hypothetical protein
MAITGHKFVASLALYQRVDDDDKIRMGQTLTWSITNETAEHLYRSLRDWTFSVNSCVEPSSIGRMFGAGNALVDVVDANADVLAVSCVMLS